MPANAYLSLNSLSGTRPHAVPDDVRGLRREDPDGRCVACRHHARIEGPAPATRYTGGGRGRGSPLGIPARADMVSA